MPVSANDFIELFETHGATKTAKILNIRERTVYTRRVNLEKKLGRQITGPHHQSQTRHEIQHPQRVQLDLNDGIILVGGDAHYWPGEASTAHRAFVHFTKKLKPKIIVVNGDLVDGASISRYPPIGWEDTPTVIQEIETTQERLGELEAVAKNARLVWPLGNHDARFETRLATAAPQYASLNGFHLKSYFPRWAPCWSCWINDDIVIKHKFKNGIHATHNNVMWSGKHMITNHLHSLKVTPNTDYNGTLFGVDTGTLADPDGPQFRDYTEDNPKNWRSGFIVLTIRDRRLMWPEVVSVVEDGIVEFRSEFVAV